jgi:hypothetical protein
MGAPRFVDMHVGVDESRHHHQVAEVVVGGAVSHIDDLALRVMHGGGTFFSLQHHPAAAKAAHP